MSSIDDRVVRMTFDNAQFEHGVRTSLASLEAITKGLKLEGATKGLSDVSAAAQNVQLGHIAAAVEGITNKFHAMSVVAITALATIVHEAATAGLSIAKSLTIDPVKSGLTEYQTNINSIQTILSNTRWQNTGLNDVNKALDTLNRYSDQTIYNFSQMARNIGTFTAAGVKLDVATNAIKGIANLAAVSGSNAEQASMAMYQLSQALATGTVKLIDWNSVVNAGMGGKVFQDALMETARVHGIAIDKMLKDAGSFRGTLEKGWLSAQILTETLDHFTGDLTEQQLISQGYTQKQAAAIVAMGKDAQDAATKVKTITQLLNTMQEAAGSGWAKTWQIIFGDFEEARTFFTSVNDVLGGFIQRSADARNEVLGDWKALGGRTVLIEAMGIAFWDLHEVLYVIGKAWREAFPAITGKNLYDITVAIRDFFAAARMGEDTMDNLRRTFAGLFAVLGIGWDIFKQVARVLVNVFSAAGDGQSDFLKMTASLGDFLVGLRKAINEGEGLIKFFDGVEKVLTPPVRLLGSFIHLLSTMFDDFDPDKAAQGTADFVKNLGPLGKLADFIAYTWDRVVHVFDNLWHALEPLSGILVERFQEISAAVGGINFSDILKAINTGVFLSFAVMIKNAIGRGGISGAISQLTSTLSTMQHTLQAATLLQIAIAIGVLTLSMSALSKIDSAALTKSLAAIGVMFAQLLAALAVLEHMPGNNVVKLYAMAASMVVLAVAIDVLTVAVKQLAALDAKELHKGLIATMLLIGSLVTAARFLPDGASLISTGLGLVILAGAVKVLASAVSDLSSMSWEELAKGLSAVGIILTELALFTRFAQANATGVLGSAGIVILAASIKILASAVKDISSISWENVGKGMAVLATSLALMGAALYLIPPTAPLSAAGVVAVAASLLLIAEAVQSISTVSWENVGKGMAVLATSLLLIGTALTLIPPTAPLSAAGVLIVALSLGMLADAMQQMGGMSWSEIAKGLVTLAGALAIISAALIVLPAALPGAAALFIVASALTILAVVLKTLGNMSWGEIGKGLLALAAAFAVLGIASALLQPVIPAMLGLGAALLLIGAGLALAGAGVFLFSAGLTALSVSGAAAAAAIVAIVSAVIGLVPTLIKELGVALLALIGILIDAVPKIVELLIKLILQLLEGLEKTVPKFGSLMLKLVLLMLDILEKAVPRMAEAGLHIILGVLQGIQNNIRKVITTAGHVVEEFLRGIGDAAPGVIQAGVDMIVSYIEGMAKAIRNNSERVGEAGADLGLAIIEGMVKGLRAGTNRVTKAAVDVAKNAWRAVTDFLGISSPSKLAASAGEHFDEGLALGLKKNSTIVEKSAESVGTKAIKSLRESLSAMTNLISSDIDAQPVITPVLDLTKIRQNAGEIQTMLSTRPLDFNASYTSAKQASDGYNTNKMTLDQAAMQPQGDTFNYTQNNTSPKALSTAEIYRQTKNQLSVAKGGLPT
jgi:tape measure domain-containing protein